MALVVTVAGTTSDSYATLSEAGTFLDWKGDASWDNASDPTKENVLKAAVRLMDLFPYTNQKSDNDQALRFPSSDMTDTSGTLYIPDQIKEAQCILALALLNSPDMEASADNAESVSVSGSFVVKMRGDEKTELIERMPSGFVERMRPWLLMWGPGPAQIWDSTRRGFI